MSERGVLMSLQSRAAAWEGRVDELLDALRRFVTERQRACAQSLRELVDRRECVRVKLEKARRAPRSRFAAACNECELALRELRSAWNTAVLRMGSTASPRRA